MYKDKEYVENVNKTYSKSFSKRQFLPKYLLNELNMSLHLKILDYGSGKDAYGSVFLREHGFDVTSYDIGKNFIHGIHEEYALEKKYDVVFASNVLNIQPSYDEIIDILNEVYVCIYERGLFYCNFPQKPRKCGIDDDRLLRILTMIFKNVEKDGNIYICKRGEL